MEGHKGSGAFGPHEFSSQKLQGDWVQELGISDFCFLPFSYRGSRGI